MTRLHRLRNRIAHHEPLIHEDLTARLADLTGVLTAVDPVLHAWVQDGSRLQTVLAQRPRPHRCSTGTIVDTWSQARG
ncbi:hypothetical protein [Pseudonocardia acidicola]|uniref:Abi-like protein n=1 Tax=Pseudonocardia acidicola TaxID=2724939 RepID=A0ABX1SK63_9PSEU|nr:hypothetical protein [Pseudonocardia acidicola]NMI01370.1 hypothetical protein [Pseudonocardia acidicola]